MITKLQLFEVETVVDIQRKENRVASSLFFSKESNLECWEKRKVKVTENCVENTDRTVSTSTTIGVLRMPIANILRGLPCGLESLRLKFTNEPSIFVDGDVAESIKRSASDRLGDLVP